MDSLSDPRELTRWRSGEPRFLDYYGDAGIRLALDRYGIAREAEKRGFHGLHIETRCDEERHTLLVSATPDDGGPRARLAEAVVRRDRLLPKPVEGLPPLDASYDVLTVDWLVLRDPRRRFSRERPHLPGQDAPGLGMGEQIFELLCRAVERLRLDGMVSTADHFHNAVLYLSLMPFLDPRHAGEVHALMQLLMVSERLNLAQASWAVHWGFVRDARQEAPYRWHGEVQVWPRATSLERYLGSDAYFRCLAEVASQCRFTLDRKGFDRRWELERDALEGRLAPPISTRPR